VTLRETMKVWKRPHDNLTYRDRCVEDTARHQCEIINRPNKTLFFACENGSRTYGFMREDSDVDIRGVYLESSSSLIGLHKPKDTITGIDQTGYLDWQLFEIRKFMNLILKSNLNCLEWIFNHQSYVNLQCHNEFRDLMKLSKQCITRKLGNHARGWAYQIYKMDWNEPKKCLYAIRPLMLYIILMRDELFISDIRELGRRMEIEDHINNLINVRNENLPTPRHLKDKNVKIYEEFVELSRKLESDCWIPKKLPDSIENEMNEQLLWLRMKPFT